MTEMTRQAVADCAESGWTIPDVAIEFGVTYSMAYKFVVKNGLKHLFRHGNKKSEDSADSRIDMARV